MLNRWCDAKTTYHLATSWPVILTSSHQLYLSLGGGNNEAGGILMLTFSNYRPANEVWGKVIFSEACVILSTGGGACLTRYHPTPPPGADIPPRDYVPPGTMYPPGLHTPPGLRTPPRLHTPPDYIPPQTTYPPDYVPPRLCTPPDYIPPGLRTPRTYVPPRGRSMCGRYASYWNTFLFLH